MAENQSNLENNIERKEREMLMAKWEWHKFNQKFPDEDSCIKELYKLSNGNSEIVCRKCQSRETRKIDERSFHCLTCHKKCWLTAGTPFAKSKKVRPWLFAQWLSKKSIRINGSQLAEMVMISKSSGAYIVKKIAILTNKMIDEIDGAEPTISCLDNLIKISEYKPEKKCLRLERKKANRVKQPRQVVTDEKAAIQPEAKTEHLKKLSKKQAALYALLNEKPQDFDTLLAKLDCDVQSISSTLTVLEIEGYITRLPGDLYIKNEKPQEKPEEKPQTKRKSQKKAIKSAKLTNFHSLIGSIKSALKTISKTIFNETLKLVDVFKKEIDETPERFTKSLLR